MPSGSDRALALCLMTIALALLALLAFQPARGDNDPPAGGGTVSGDWTVTDSRSYSGCTIDLSGDLVVSQGFKLDLSGVRLVLHCAADGQWGIWVNPGGELVLRDGCNLTSSDPAFEYLFRVNPAGKLTVSDSEVRECGYAWGVTGETAGIYVKSSLCDLNRSLFTSCHYGFVLDSASLTATDCRFVSNEFGAGGVNSSAVLQDCTLDLNTNGLNLERSPWTLQNCTVLRNFGFGVLAYRSALAVKGCDFALNSAGGCVLMDCDASVGGCTLREGTYGIYSSGGAPLIQNCTLTGNSQGLYLYRSSAVVEDCRLERNLHYGVSSFYGEPSVRRCLVSYTGYSPVDGKSYGTALQAFSSNLTVTGGIFSLNHFALECRYSNPRLLDMDIRENYYGIYSTESRLDLRGCSFTRQEAYGAFMSYSSRGDVRDCRFTCETIGLYLHQALDADVRNCTFAFCKRGLKVDACGAAAVIRECSFDRNSIACEVTGSFARFLGNDFTRNQNATLTGSGASPEIRGNGFRINPSVSVDLFDCGGTVADNQFLSNEGTCVRLRDSRTEVVNNTFGSNSGTALHSLGSRSEPAVHLNVISGNELGIALTAGSGGRYFENDLGGNRQAGFALSGSHGDIHCNTVSGSVHGISLSFRSDPSVHDNLVSGNEGGITCIEFSNATLWRNELANNSKFGISVLSSWPDIRENSVRGSLDGIRTDATLWPPVRLSKNLVSNCTDGLRSTDCTLELWDCNFSRNADAGAYLWNSTATADRCSFRENEAGLTASGCKLELRGCDFQYNRVDGVETELTDAFIGSCFFFRNTDGVMDLGNSTLVFEDGTFQQDLAYGFYCGPNTHATWNVVKSALALDERFWLAGNLSVFSGGLLRLNNASLFMALGSPGEHSIEVWNGARCEIVLNSTVTAAYPSNRFAFRVMAGANFTFTDGLLQHCGDYWGVAGERAGLQLLTSDCLLQNVDISDCAYGLVANGVTARFSGLDFFRCSRAVEAIASRLVFDNCSIWYSEVLDLELTQGSRVTLYNTTFTRSAVNLLGPGNTLEVYWYLGVNVIWENRVVVARAQLSLVDAAGDRSYAGLTDDRGWLTWVPVLEYRQASSGRDVKNPYAVTIRMGNITKSVTLEFTSSFNLYITLEDSYPPVLEVTSPLAGQRLNFTPVLIGGNAFDFETGLAKVEVQIDGGGAFAANGTFSWSVLIPLADGNHTIRVIATDAVGNWADTEVEFAVDTVISLLEISYPPEGYLTRIPTVQLNGSTEAEARITVDGRPVAVSQGRFSTTIFLSEGNNTILMSATDPAGNTATVARRVVLDSTLPFIDIISPRNDSYTSFSEVLVSGRTEPGARVTVDGEQAVNSEGRFSLAVRLSGETTLVNLACLDPAGNFNSTVLVIHLDTEMPPLAIAFPRYGLRTERRNVTLNGTTEPFATVAVGDALTTADASGRFALDIALLHGNNTLLVKVTDRAGNSNSTAWHVVRTRPFDGRGPSPWLETVVVFAVILAAQNAALYFHYRKRGRGAAPPPGTPAPPPPAAAGTGSGGSGKESEAETVEMR